MRYLTAVDNCFLDYPGGAARVAWDTATAMRDRGHEVTMVAFSRKEQSRHTVDTHEGITILRVVKPQLAKLHPGRLLAGIGAVRQAYREKLAREQRWDIVHVHTLQAGNGLYHAFKNAPRRIATVHSPAVLEWEANRVPDSAFTYLKGQVGKPLLSWLEGRLLRRCHELQTLSRFTRERIDAFHGVGKKVRVIPHFLPEAAGPNSPKTQARARLGWPEDQVIIFTIRNHVHRNGIDLAIRAAAPFTAARRCQFYIAGEGAQRPAYRELAKSLDQSDGIRFPGRLSEENLTLAYQAADVFLLPSRSLECFGIIILEALSHGCPVLASNAAAIPETLTPVLPDFLFEAGSTEAMRVKIRAFLDGELTVPSAEDLQDFVRERYGRETIIPKLVELLEGPG